MVTGPWRIIMHLVHVIHSCALPYVCILNVVQISTFGCMRKLILSFQNHVHLQPAARSHRPPYNNPQKLQSPQQQPTSPTCHNFAQKYPKDPKGGAGATPRHTALRLGGGGRRPRGRYPQPSLRRSGSPKGHQRVTKRRSTGTARSSLAFPCPRAAATVSGFWIRRSDRIFFASSSTVPLKRIRSVRRKSGIFSPNRSKALRLPRRLPPRAQISIK